MLKNVFLYFFAILEHCVVSSHRNIPRPRKVEEREKERKVIVVVQPKAFYLTQAHSQVAYTSVTKIGAFCLKEMAILVLSWRLGFY